MINIPIAITITPNISITYIILSLLTILIITLNTVIITLPIIIIKQTFHSTH